MNLSQNQWIANMTPIYTPAKFNQISCKTFWAFIFTDRKNLQSLLSKDLSEARTMNELTIVHLSQIIFQWW